MKATLGKAASKPGEEFLPSCLPKKKKKKSHFYDTTTKASVLSEATIHVRSHY